MKTARLLFSTATIHLLALLIGCGSAANQYEAPPPPEVTVASPVLLSVTPFLDENGFTEAAEEAFVRARVRGFIQEIKFDPAQPVTKGDILYQIEPDQYEAKMQSAEASLAAAEASIAVAEAEVETARAQVTRATNDLNREQRLLDNNAGSQADYDAAVAAKDSAVAAERSALAAVEATRAEKGRAEALVTNAKLDLNYTVVRAPISGRITKTNVKLGNLVENGDELATVVDDERIFANFSLSDRQVLALVDEYGTGDASRDVNDEAWRKIDVLLSRESDAGYPFTGKLDYIDQTGVDQDTGTIGLRAVFDNPRGYLFAGLFVMVRVPWTESVERLLIPELATGRDQLGRYVLTVNSENKVERTPVVVERRVSGWAIIKEGLSAQSRVIIDGIQRARPGAKVAPSEQTLSVDNETLMRGMEIGRQSDTPPPATDDPATDDPATDDPASDGQVGDGQVGDDVGGDQATDDSAGVNGT